MSCASVLLTYDLVSRIGIESGAYPIFFEIGIQNLVCECILGWRSVPFHFCVSVTLTSDLVSRNGMESGAYLLYYLGRNPKCIFGWWYVVYHFLVTVTLTSDLLF